MLDGNITWPQECPGVRHTFFTDSLGLQEKKKYWIFTGKMTRTYVAMNTVK